MRSGVLNYTCLGFITLKKIECTDLHLIRLNSSNVYEYLSKPSLALNYLLVWLFRLNNIQSHLLRLNMYEHSVKVKGTS